MHVVPLVLNQGNSGFLSPLVYSDTTALNYRMILSSNVHLYVTLTYFCCVQFMLMEAYA